MRLLATCSYKGINYNGWQVQPNLKTIQGTIEFAISKILNTKTTIYGSGRTDTGVSANGQTFHFDVNKAIDMDKFLYSLNCVLPDDIYVNELKEVSNDFHARFNVKRKTYQYTYQTKKRSPFNYEIAAFMPLSFDENLLAECLQLFKGEHNFINFTSKEEDEKKFIRTIYEVDYQYENDILIITLVGNGFMRYMVRDIVGTVMAVATGRENIDYIRQRLINVEKRLVTSYKAEGNGLNLLKVEY